MQLNVNRLSLCFVGGRWPVPRPHNCIREWDDNEIMGSILRIRRVVLWSCNCHVREEVSTCFPIFACQTRANFKLLRHFNFVCSPFSILPFYTPFPPARTHYLWLVRFLCHFINIFRTCSPTSENFSETAAAYRMYKNKKEATLCFIYEPRTHKKFARDSTMRVAF